MDSTLDTVFPAGTILACPGCGQGLYKVMVRSTTEELVQDDGAILIPLNHTIPPRSAWAPLACPWCGGRLFQNGKIHTLQRGWV